MRPDAPPLVCDATVVFNLGHRGRLEQLAERLKADRGLQITPDVEREVTRDPHDGFYERFLPACFTRCAEPLTALNKIPAEFAPMLGDGEKSVLSLAKQRQWTACIDESLGRKAALAMGLLPTGTLGLLEEAVNRQWLTDAEAMDAIRRLHQNRFVLPLRPGVNDDFAEYMQRVRLRLPKT